MNFIKGFKPSYYDNFYCLGKNCKYTCCQEWEINILGKEMENWKNKAPELFEEYSKVTKKSGKDNFVMCLNEEGKCPFLNEEGLCSMQKKYGYELLSSVCKRFPRKKIDYNDMVEMHLSPGCEMVIQQLIKEKEGIKLIHYKMKSTSFTRLQKNKEREMKRPIFQYYYDIKFLLLSILQNRDYTIEERVLILGIAMKKLDEMEKHNRITEIPIFVDAFLENMETEDIAKRLKKFIYNEEIQMLHNAVNVGITIISLNLGKWDEISEGIKKRITPRYEDEAELVKSEKRIYASLNFTKKYEFQEKEYSVRKYKEAIKEYKKFIKGKEYYIENYLVTWLLFNDIPFSLDKFDIWDEYCYFVIMYSMYRFILTCCLNENSSDEEFIRYTVKFARTVVHSIENYPTQFINILKEKEKNNLDYLAIMLLQEDE